MPRIDDPNFKKKPFKKERIRAWDKDLHEKLFINKPQPLNTTVEEIGQQEQADFTESDELNTVTEIAINSAWSMNEVNEVEKVRPGFSESSSKVQARSLIHPILNSSENEHNIQERIAKLTGIEQKIFFLVHDLCIDRKSNTTGEIASLHFDRAIGVSNRNSRETAIKRLLKKGLLYRNKGKAGSNSMLNFSINEAIKNEAMRFVRNQSKYSFLNLDVDSVYPQFKRFIKLDAESVVEEY
ncbi:MAG: hypothetical protein KBD25_00055 [Rickettsiaceae bacterium]|nr:hypothetical protein [Rickettsiaceae bacterium]